MSTIIFLYNKKEVNIQCEKKEKMETIIKKFCKELKILKEDVNFLYNGSAVDMDYTEDQIIMNKENKKLIIVTDNYTKKENQEIFINSKIIICPECYESASISMEDYLISISNCKNGHKINNIPLDEFENSQKINMKKFFVIYVRETI